jgi:hypothetical protein
MKMGTLIETSCLIMMSESWFPTLIIICLSSELGKKEVAHTFTMLCSLLCEDEKQAVAVKSQLQQLARPMYSNPPVHGALIVSTILGDPELKKIWLKEVKVEYHTTISYFYISL